MPPSTASRATAPGVAVPIWDGFHQEGDVVLRDCWSTGALAKTWREDPAGIPRWDTQRRAHLTWHFDMPIEYEETAARWGAARTMLTVHRHMQAAADAWNRACGVRLYECRSREALFRVVLGALGPRGQGWLVRSFGPDSDPAHRAIVLFAGFFAGRPLSRPALCECVPSDGVRRSEVLCHALGHVLGLVHEEDRCAPVPVGSATSGRAAALPADWARSDAHSVMCASVCMEAPLGAAPRDPISPLSQQDRMLARSIYGLPDYVNHVPERGSPQPMNT